MITIKKQFSEDYSALSKAIKDKLPELEDYIEKKFKIKCKLKFNYDQAKRRVSIYSDSIMREANSDIDRLMFKDINLSLWGGDLRSEYNTSWIYFNAHFSYEHVVGGSNGVELPDGQIYYDVQEHEWLDRREAETKFGRK